jgi:hypothetical protein
MLHTFIMCDHVIITLISTLGISDSSQTSTHTADEHIENALSIGDVRKQNKKPEHGQ